MRVLNNKFLRVSLVVCLILSMALTSAFAGSSVNVGYAEPPTGSNDGYISIEFSSGNLVTLWWHAQASINSSVNVVPIVDVTNTGSSIKVDIYGNPLAASYNIDYNVSRRTQTYVWLMGSGMTSGTASYSFSYSSLGTISNITYGGLVSNLIGFDSRVGSLNLSFESAEDIYSKVNQIYVQMESVITQLNNSNTSLNEVEVLLGGLTDSIDLLHQKNVFWLEAIWNRLERTNQWLERLFDRMGFTNTTLAEIRDILIEFQNTTLDESTDPLPSQGLVDFESSQGSLRDESDVSNNLDSVFNDADFGSFSNGLNVIWSLLDSVLNTNPIFFTLVILVLTLGLLNLIFNRR